jgi:hypothetical protein
MVVFNTTNTLCYPECASKPFAEYYMSAAVGKVFQQLYENSNNLRDHMEQVCIRVVRQCVCD